MLEIAVFGSLVVTRGGDALGAREFNGLKPKQLLEILVSRGGRATSKDSLATALWGDDLPQNFAASLEHYISVLRRRLEPGVPPRKSVVVTASGGYRLDTDRVSIDLNRFDDLVERASTAAGPAARALLEEAVGLARGEVFEDEPYAEWAQDIRDTYRSRLVVALVAAAEAALRDGDHRCALAHAERAVTLDAHAETAYRTAMLAVYALGRQEEALRWYTRCRNALVDGLGVEPFRETVELQTAILNHRPVEDILQLPSTRPTAPDVTDPRLPLLGRTAELAALARATDLSHGSGLRVVMVEGESGSGKTRLLEEMRAATPEATVLVSCSQLETELPYATMLHILHACGVEVGARLATALDAAGREGGTSRLAALEAVAEAACAAPQRAVLVDDAQWADNHTIAALDYLRHRTRGKAHAVVLAVRTDDLPADHSLRRISDADVVRLGPLTREDLASVDIPGLHERTGGLPLFVAAALKAESERDSEKVAEALAAAVRRRCARLGPHHYRTLTVAAVLPQPFVPEVLAALLDIDALTLVEELEELCERRVLRAADERFDFAHPMLRATLADTVSPARRTLLAREAAAHTPAPASAAHSTHPTVGSLPRQSHGESRRRPRLIGVGPRPLSAVEQLP